MTFASVIIMLMVSPAQAAAIHDLRPVPFYRASARSGMLAVTPLLGYAAAAWGGAALHPAAIALQPAETAIDGSHRGVTPVTNNNMKMTNGEDKA